MASSLIPQFSRHRGVVVEDRISANWCLEIGPTRWYCFGLTGMAISCRRVYLLYRILKNQCNFADFSIRQRCHYTRMHAPSQATEDATSSAFSCLVSRSEYACSSWYSSATYHFRLDWPVFAASILWFWAYCSSCCQPWWTFSAGSPLEESYSFGIAVGCSGLRRILELVHRRRWRRRFY